MKTFWTIVVAVFLIGVRGGEDSVPILDQAERFDAPFKAGERLRYAIYWDPPAVIDWLIGDLQAGDVTVVIKESEFEGRETLTIEAVASTVGFVRRRFVAVDDRFESTIDRRNFRSYRLEKVIREGEKARRNVVSTFHYGQDRIHVSKTDLRDGQPKVEFKVFEGIPGPLADVLSVFYVARLRPMAPGDRYLIHLADEKAPDRIEVEVVKQETVKTLLGQFKALRLTTVGSFFSNAGGFLVWYSSGPERLPVRFQADAKIGKVYGELIAVDTGTHSRSVIRLNNRD